MVYPDNCLDFLTQTTHFLGHSTQVLPTCIIGITITLICLAPPHAVFQFISAVSMLHNRDFAQTFHTIFWLFLSEFICHFRRSAREQQQYYLLFAVYLKMLSVTLNSCI